MSSLNDSKKEYSELSVFFYFILLTVFLFCSTSALHALAFEQHNISERFELETINHILVADVDQDDDLDIVCCFDQHARVGFGPGRISWFENDDEWTEHVLLEDAYWAQGSAVADIDQDGDLDIVAVVDHTFENEEEGPGRLYLFENQGEEEFRTVILDDEFIGAYQVAVADLDDDDDLDVIGTSKYSIVGEISGGLYIWENVGDGEFERHEIISDRDGQGLLNLKVVDLDQDGLLDIVTVSYWVWMISWLINEGDMSFELNQIEERENLLDYPWQIEVADLDEDDDLDFVVGSMENDIAWFENDGEQNFQKHMVAERRGGGLAIVVSDINGDDRPDIICHARRGGIISWWSNVGDGMFNVHRVIDEFRSPWSMAVGDINDDGLPDIVVGSSGGELVWFEQTDEDEQFFETYMLPIDNFWSMISMPFVPSPLDIEQLFQPLIENENLMIMKDHEGHFLVPGMFNNLPDFEVSQGYKIKLHREDTLVVEGHEVEDFRRMRLPEGWSIAAYFPSEAQDAPQAFRFISELGLILAKDDQGGFYYPELEFNNMEDLRRNKGYKIKLESEGVAGWNYDINRPPGIDDKKSEPSLELSHFKSTILSDNNMSIIIKDAPLSGEIGVFTSDNCLVGAAVCDGAAMLGVTVWGDDTFTENVNGAVNGQELSFRHWDGSEQVAASMTWIQGDGTYRADELSIANMSNVSPKPNSFSIISVSPNPFNSTTTIKYSLDIQSNISLQLYNLSGREIALLHQGLQPAGEHSATFDSEVLPSGLYFAILESNNRLRTIKLVCVK